MRLEFVACAACREFERLTQKGSAGCWVCGWSECLPLAMATELALIGAGPTDDNPSKSWAEQMRALRMRYGLPSYPASFTTPEHHAT